MPLDEEQTITVRAVALLAAANFFNGADKSTANPHDVTDAAKLFEAYLTADLPAPST